ncbi:hypothetical protein [Pseudolactococcus raffinolactis]|uniref:hypothetical protein n=1 Tax=Pseudolactococcus raffinolactis TaxID=1366 RepID=UPI001436A340|nr:hypothetical protein [Lactococcus raffinolactis]QIW50798.1 hypothetical protein GU337_02330 [Lactococcus raffinolactis]
MNLKELAKQAIENSETLNTSNEAKKRTAVAFINRELIESRQYTSDTLPTQEIDDTIEEVLHGN